MSVSSPFNLTTARFHRCYPVLQTWTLAQRELSILPEVPPRSVCLLIMGAGATQVRVPPKLWGWGSDVESDREREETERLWKVGGERRGDGKVKEDEG